MVTAATASSNCGCPERKPPPGPPKHPLSQEMKAWLLERCAESAFNKCPHQQLPQMDGPPVDLHMVKDAIPRKCTTPATIPLHWQEQVKAD